MAFGYLWKWDRRVVNVWHSKYHASSWEMAVAPGWMTSLHGGNYGWIAARGFRVDLLQATNPPAAMAAIVQMLIKLAT